jgi:hypothetical protein
MYVYEAKTKAYYILSAQKTSVAFHGMGVNSGESRGEPFEGAVVLNEASQWSKKMKKFGFSLGIDH